MSGSHIVVVLTNTNGDVERHRVCDKHIKEVAEPSPAVTVMNLSTRGLMSIVVVVPSNQPPIYGRMTLRWPPVYPLVVVRAFNVTGAPPNQLVVGMTSGISDSCWPPVYPLVVVRAFKIHRDVSIREDGQISQLRRLSYLTHDPLHQQSSSSGESLQGQTAYVHAIMTPYDSCRRVL